MNKGVRLKDDMALASVLRKKLEQWLTESNPALVKQLEKKYHHFK